MRIETFGRWLDERLSISTIARTAQKKEVPLHRQSIWYYFGGISLTLAATTELCMASTT